jgi:FkbM family methyltransferase
MKYFISLGMYDGSVIDLAMRVFPDCDKYYGFEPVPSLYAIAVSKFRDDKKVALYNLAATTKDEKDVKMYVGSNLGVNCTITTGSSLVKSKSTGGITEDNFIMVDTVDFSRFIAKEFDADDYIIVDVDIEGTEYDVLWHMINNSTIGYIKKLYCEWHYRKMKFSKHDHKVLVKRLNELGFNLTGKYDEFDVIFRYMDKRYCS